ncbi:MAG: hypothetical protein QM737_21770 [Ferruginibacter sp.]
MIYSSKKLLIFFLIFFTGKLFAQDAATLLKYERRSDTLVMKLKSKAISDEEKKELKNIAYGIQNHGQLLADQLGEYATSLKYIDKAIELFISLEDTVSEANNRKFKAFELGMLGYYPAAKAEGKTAIRLYSIKNNPAGVAVSQLDLCRVYDQEQNLDSAIYFCKLSLNYWKSTTNNFRIFGMQMMLIHLFTASKQYDDAKLIQKDCEKFIGNKDIGPRELKDLYMVLIKLYKATNQNDQEKIYRQKLKEIENDAGQYKSYYEL